VMASIWSRDTTPELALRRALYEAGIRGWRLSPPSVQGRPDLVFTRWKLAIFVDGCFWHGCPRCYRRPASSVDYWDRKLARNRKRDADVETELRSVGWAVLRVWEHQVVEDVDRCVALVADMLSRRRGLTSE
jgi:DNA mismatch endonuclease (patch repair protein)